jgi:F-type H+-transporting ATPase subunit b
MSISTLLQNAHFWVGIAFLILVIIMLFVGVPKMLTGFLDGRAAAVQAQLDEATRLREEAQALLAQIKTRREEAERFAAEMMRNAETDAQRLHADARTRLEETLQRRSEQAERNIAIAESRARAEVTAAAADLAANMAERVLAGRLAAGAPDPLVDAAIGDLGAKLQ